MKSPKYRIMHKEASGSAGKCPDERGRHESKRKARTTRESVAAMAGPIRVSNAMDVGEHGGQDRPAFASWWRRAAEASRNNTGTTNRLRVACRESQPAFQSPREQHVGIVQPPQHRVAVETKCRKQGLHCDFPIIIDNAIIMFAVVRTSNVELRNELIRKNGDLMKVRETARAFEIAREGAKENQISHAGVVNKISRPGGYSMRNRALNSGTGSPASRTLCIACGNNTHQREAFASQNAKTVYDAEEAITLPECVRNDRSTALTNRSEPWKRDRTHWRARSRMRSRHRAPFIFTKCRMATHETPLRH